MINFWQRGNNQIMSKSTNKTAKLKIEFKSVKELTKNPKNARTHSEKQIKKLAASIKEFGFIGAIAIDSKGLIWAGHARLAACELLGLETIPYVNLDHLTATKRRAYMLADNRIANESGWDDDILRIELSELQAMDFDLAITGFDNSELEAIFSEDAGPADGEDDVPTIPKKPYSKLGQIYQLGEHRLMCGDSTKKEDVGNLMAGEIAHMVFTDPPYNVDYGKEKNRTIKNDNHTVEDWDVFVRGYISNLLENCSGNIFISMSDKELGHMQSTFIELGGKWSSFIIWVKNSLVISQKDYHSKHETIMYGWRDGVSGRYRPTDRTLTDVWEFDKPKRSDEHPTMKPVELVEKTIKNGCRTKSTVLDLFGGSGSTLIACEKTKRKCFMMELDPHYVDVIITRWENFTGEKAVLLK